MSSVNYILPLKAPAPLPATGVTIVTFEVWKNTLISHLEQDANRHHFLPGEKYAKWTVAEFGKRINSLVNTDPDKITADVRKHYNIAWAKRALGSWYNQYELFNRKQEHQKKACTGALLGR